MNSAGARSGRRWLTYAAVMPPSEWPTIGIGPSGVEHGLGVAGEVVEQVGAGRPVGATVAAEVEAVDAVAGVAGDEEVVRRRRPADAVQEQHLRPVVRPVDRDLQPDPVVVDAHAGDRRSASRRARVDDLASDQRGTTETSATKRTASSGAQPAAASWRQSATRRATASPSADRGVDEQLVVQAQHDRGGEAVAGEAGADRDGPALEQLGRRALDHRVAAVAAHRRGARAGVALADLVGVRRAEADQPAAVRADAAPDLAGLVGVVEVAPWPPGTRRRGGAAPGRRGRSSGRTSRRARRPSPSPGRRRAGRRPARTCRRSASPRARARSPDTAASTRGSIWPRSARTNTWPGSATTAGPQVGGHAVQPGASPSSARPRRPSRSTRRAGGRRATCSSSQP